MNTPEPEKTLYGVEPITVRADHHDPLQDVGDWMRVLCGWVIAVLAVLFAVPAVICPIAIVVLALKGDFQIVGPLAIMTLMCGLFIAAPLFWLARRLLRKNRSTNGEMVIPLWLIQVMGVVVVAGSPLCFYLSKSDPNFPIKPPFLWEAVVGGPIAGIGMIVAPWLAKRRKRRDSEQSNARANEEML
jgi:uncharacterized membrane-anchored protein YitT (DUF2179 family)